MSGMEGTITNEFQKWSRDGISCAQWRSCVLTRPTACRQGAPMPRGAFSFPLSLILWLYFSKELTIASTMVELHYVVLLRWCHCSSSLHLVPKTRDFKRAIWTGTPGVRCDRAVPLSLSSGNTSCDVGGGLGRTGRWWQNSMNNSLPGDLQGQLK